MLPSFAVAPRNKGSNGFLAQKFRACRLTNDLGLPSIVVTAFFRHHHLRYEEPDEREPERQWFVVVQVSCEAFKNFEMFFVQSLLLYKPYNNIHESLEL